MNSARLITVRRGSPPPQKKNKNYGEVGKTEGKLLNDSLLRGKHRVKSYRE